MPLRRRKSWRTCRDDSIQRVRLGRVARREACDTEARAAVPRLRDVGVGMNVFTQTSPKRPEDARSYQELLADSIALRERCMANARWCLKPLTRWALPKDSWIAYVQLARQSNRCAVYWKRAIRNEAAL